MNWACDLLGVAPDADATAIKRAYARLLRTTRPDEDAAAFQRLNTAYQMALAQAGKLAPRTPQPPPRAPEAHAADVDAPPMPPAAPQEAPPSAPPALETLTPPAAPRRPAAELPPLEVLQAAAAAPAPMIDVAQLARRVIDAACHVEGPLALSEWLAHCPELWSFRIKQITGQLVLQALAQATRPMQADNFDALLGFFDLNNVLTGLNPVALEQRRNQQTLHWEMQHDVALMTRRLRILDKQGKPDIKRARAYVDLLQQPHRWRQTIAATLTRRMPLQLAHIVNAFCQGNLNQLPASFNKPHAQFWLHATNNDGTHHEHWVLVAIRILFAALLCAGVSVCLMLLPPQWPNLGFLHESGAGIGAVALAAFAGSALLLWVLAGTKWVDYWQCLPETSTTPKPWLRRAFLPLICALTLALNYLADIRMASTIIMTGILLVCVRRYLRRAAIRIAIPTFLRRRPILLIYVLVLVASPILAGAMSLVANHAFPLLATAITMVVWGIDMWRHRVHWLRQRVNG